MRLLLLKPNTLFFVVLISALLSLPAFADVEKFYGRAVNEKGELIFIEEHTIRYQNQRIAAMKTTYYNKKMNKIGELVSDFSAGAQFGSYDFKDNRAQKNFSNEVPIRLWDKVFIPSFKPISINWSMEM